MQIFFCNIRKKSYVCRIKNHKNKNAMLTAELETPKLRRQIIDRVQTLDSRALTKLLFIIDHNQYDNYVDEEDDVTIDLDFPTPQTPEEASREMDEIEEEYRQGKFYTLEESNARIDKIFKKYERNYI